MAQGVSRPPVVLFVYRNLHSAHRVVRSLQENEESEATELVVFSDGPKTESEEPAIQDIRKYFATVRGFKSVEIVPRQQNLGLSESFISGISETLRLHEAAIFLEDDNLVSPHFLNFMSRALLRYADDERVICVSGYSYLQMPKPKGPYFLLGAETWSMGTWRRGWANFEPDTDILLSEINRLGLKRSLNMYGFNFYEMLESHRRGEIDSWGVRWWASAVHHRQLCLYPSEPLCISIGDKEDAIHTRSFDPIMRHESNLADERVCCLPVTPALSSRVTVALRTANFFLKFLRLRRRHFMRKPVIAQINSLT